MKPYTAPASKRIWRKFELDLLPQDPEGLLSGIEKLMGEKAFVISFKSFSTTTVYKYNSKYEIEPIPICKLTYVCNEEEANKLQEHIESQGFTVFVAPITFDRK